MSRLFRARTLQLYVLKEFLTSFALSASACTLFMLLVTFFTTANEYEEFGINTAQVALLSPFLLPKALAYAIPLAVMISSTMVLGRLTAENEILAAQAGGAPLRVLATPILLSSLILSFFCLWCNDGGLRWGWTTIRNEVLKLDKPESFFNNLNKPGTSLSIKLEGGNMARINLLPTYTDAAGKLKRPIHIAYFQNQQVGQTVLAQDFQYNNEMPTENGERTLVLTLYEARILGEHPSFFDEATRGIPLPALNTIIRIGESRGEKGWSTNYNDGRGMKDSFKERRRFLLERAAAFGAACVAGAPIDPASAPLMAETWSQTRISAEALYGPGGALDRQRADETEFHRKLALSFLPLAMAMLGFGLGLLVQKSQRLIGFLIGIVVYALIYYPMMIVSKELASAGKAGVWIVWMPDTVHFLAGYVLWRAYERGALGQLPGWFAALGANLGGFFRSIGTTLWRPISGLQDLGALFFRRRTDAYVAGYFILPLLVTVLSVIALLTALDLAEHGGEVIEGVLRANDPLPGVPIRNQTEALLDVGTFYGIRALERICDMLPLLVLLAGVMCVYVLVRNGEHLILKSAGIPLQRAFRPILIIAVIVSLLVAGIRETVLPDLIMARDYLKPMVYHRNPSPTAVALHTMDAEGKPVLFEMSQYSSSQRSGRDLRIYMLGSDLKRIPCVTADRVFWDGGGWRLQTENLKLQTSKKKENTLIEHGWYLRPELNSLSPDQDEVRGVNLSRTPLELWKGTITPSLIESERLGPGVMRLNELSSAGSLNPEFRVEWWKRLGEIAMGVLLLWMTVPLLVREESHGPLIGAAFSIVIGAAYWGMNMGFAELARAAFLPVWAPLIPHAVFFLLGRQRFYAAMET